MSLGLRWALVAFVEGVHGGFGPEAGRHISIQQKSPDQVGDGQVSFARQGIDFLQPMIM